LLNCGQLKPGSIGDLIPFRIPTVRAEDALTRITVITVETGKKKQRGGWLRRAVVLMSGRGHVSVPLAPNRADAQL
jgi:hypothetical protein